ncbi:MAG TPA: dienelactone hydrolase family protein [Pseudolysinimonas sp.]
MTEILLFHHALGLTTGVTAFADRIRAAGHTVHTPDLYDGRTFETVAAGVDHARSIGFGVLVERGAAIAAGLPEALVYAGISMGVMPAQNLAQNRAGAVGALLFESSVPAEEFGGPWPAGVPLQIHGMDGDPEFIDSGDVDAGRELVAAADDGELFLYLGEQHLFIDDSLPSYDAEAAALVLKRVLEFLARV